MMSEHDTPVVETPDFVLAALERAGDAVVIVDRDSQVSYLQRRGRTDLGTGPRGGAWPSCRPSGARRIAGTRKATEDPRTISPRLRSARRMAAVSVPRCRSRTSRSAVKAAASHSSATSPKRSCGANGWRVLNLVADKTNRAVVVTDRNLRDRLHQRRVYRDVRLFGRGSAGPAGQRIAGGPRIPTAGRWQSCGAGWMTETGGEEEILAYDKNGDEIWMSASVKAFRDGHGRVKYMFAPADRHHRDQAVAVAAAADHERAGRRNPDHRDRRPALPAGRGDRARRGFLAAPYRCRRTDSSARRPQPARRLFPGAGWRRDRPGCRLLRLRGLFRQAGAGDGSRHRSALAAVQDAAARSRLARLLVHADQGQGRPRDRHLRVLFQGMPRAEPLASAHRRRLRRSLARWRSSARKPAPRSRGWPITTC